MILYHVTTAKKAKKYRQTGYIKKPVRGFTTIEAAMAWAIKVGRKIIYEIDAQVYYKLTNHHNRFGQAWWADHDVYNFKCVFSADKDA